MSQKEKADGEWQAWEGEEAWPDWDGENPATTPSKSRVTLPSDLELYERRTWYRVWPYDVTEPSPHLPKRETPEDQVEHMSAYEFFRFVKFHGGRAPYFTWHDPDGLQPWLMPIVMMSAVV